MSHALITGASEGIGRCFALQLAQQGFHITATARNTARLNSLLDQLGTIAPNHDHQVLTLDLSDCADRKTLLTQLDKVHYQLCINNAGLGFENAFTANSAAEVQAMLQVNTVALTEIAWGFLHAANSGDSLINVGSIVGFMPMPNLAVYAATKAYVVSLSQALWAEYRKKNIYVMALCPGFTETQFASRAGGSQLRQTPKFLRQSAEQVVQIALQALNKRQQPVTICGWHNRFLLSLMHKLPRRWFLQSIAR